MTKPSKAHSAAAKYFTKKARVFRASSIVNRSDLRDPVRGLDPGLQNRMNTALGKKSFKKIIKGLRKLRDDLSKQTEKMYRTLSNSEHDSETWKIIADKLIKNRLLVAELANLIHNLQQASEYNRAAAINSKLAAQLNSTGN
ncbi:MAG: hypothetical protein Pars2KO_29580 [Parasphingorhabdus sp.]